MGLPNVWISIAALHRVNGIKILIEKRKEEVDNSGKPGIVHFPR
jgi:hypothetical protein